MSSDNTKNNNNNTFNSKDNFFKNKLSLKKKIPENNNLNNSNNNVNNTNKGDNNTIINKTDKKIKENDLLNNSQNEKNNVEMNIEAILNQNKKSSIFNNFFNVSRNNTFNNNEKKETEEKSEPIKSIKSSTESSVKTYSTIGIDTRIYREKPKNENNQNYYKKPNVTASQPENNELKKNNSEKFIKSENKTYNSKTFYKKDNEIDLIGAKLSNKQNASLDMTMNRLRQNNVLFKEQNLLRNENNDNNTSRNENADRNFTKYGGNINDSARRYNEKDFGKYGNNINNNFRGSSGERNYPRYGNNPNTMPRRDGGDRNFSRYGDGASFQKDNEKNYNLNYPHLSNNEESKNEKNSKNQENNIDSEKILNQFLSQKNKDLEQAQKKEYMSILGFKNSFIKSINNPDDKEIKSVKQILSNVSAEIITDIISTDKDKNDILNKKKKKENIPLVKKINGEDRFQERTTRARRSHRGHIKKMTATIKFNNNPLSLKELAAKMNITDKDLIRHIKIHNMHSLLKNSHIIPLEDCILLAELMHYKYIIEDDFHTFIENNILNKYKRDLPGSPVIAIVGHIDHGKTSLVESMTNLNLCKKEDGEITQKVTSYSVKHNDRIIRIIDTPGHSVFKNARNLAMEICDLVILIVSAFEGVQQQTVDNIKFLQENNMPFIIVITKIDMNKKYESIYNKLNQYDIVSSEFGGTNEILAVSARTKENIPELLNYIMEFTDIHDMKSDILSEGHGYILDSWKSPGAGIRCSVLLQEGCLKEGDTIILNNGQVIKIRMLMVNNVRKSEGNKYDIIEFFGANEYIDTNEKFWVCNDKKLIEKMLDLIEKNNKQIQKRKDIIHNLQVKKDKAEIKSLQGVPTKKKRKNRKLKPVIQPKVEDKKVIKFILSGESKNDINALEEGLKTMQENNKIGDYIILSSILGVPSEVDIDMIKTVEGTVLLCFNVSITQSQISNIESKKIPLFHEKVIYKIFSDLEEYYNNQFNYEEIEEECGYAEVVAIFKVQKKSIAGCIVRNGLIIRNKKCKIRREGEFIGEGNVDSLKNQENDIKEAKNKQECGIYISNFTGKYQLQDQIVCYRTKRITRTQDNKITSEKYL